MATAVRDEELQALPAPLAIRLRGADASDEEEKAERSDEERASAADVSDDTNGAAGAGPGLDSAISAEKMKVKESRRTAVGEGVGDLVSSEAIVEEDEEGKTRNLKRPSSMQSVRSPSARSPSLLTASFLVGRDRMARAAKAWRQGARRAGLLGAEHSDDDDDWGYVEDGATADVSNNNPDPTDWDDDGQSTTAHGNGSKDETPANNLARQPSPNAVAAPLCAPRLIPSLLAPTSRLPKMVQLWSFLDRIECISIRDFYFVSDGEDGGGTVYYVMDVYNYQEQHWIPTHRHRTLRSKPRRTPSAMEAPLRAPDYQIQQRFSSFMKLRNRVMSATHRKHPRVPTQPEERRPPSSSHRHCSYCQRISAFIAIGNESIAPLDWRTKFFTTAETRKALLSQFITELVFLVREHRDDCSNLTTLTMLQQPPSGYVQRCVPGILKRFLTVQTGENFMR